MPAENKKAVRSSVKALKDKSTAELKALYAQPLTRAQKSAIERLLRGRGAQIPETSGEVIAGPGEQRVIHKVKSGETLSSIASKHHTTVNNIKRWNNLKSNTIHVGQRLYIYGSAGKSSGSSSAGSTTTTSSKSANQAAATATSTYTVKKGDTLGGIAKKTGVPLNTIYKLNGLNAKSKIYPGMKIRTK